MAKKKPQLNPEWSHPVDVQNVGRNPLKVKVSPDDTARKGLMQRLGVVSLDYLEADITLARDSNSAVIHITGHLKAGITQNCVVTLEPIVSEINESFEAWYANPEEAISLTKVRHDKKISAGNTEMPLLEEHEDPEPIVDGKIDLGELVTQYLSLAIDPYPHKEGVQFEIGDDVPLPKSDLQKNPFAALKDWKNRKDSQ